MPRLYGKTETIHKTVRLTQEQIDLIESQGQDTFTANLDHLLNEVLLGESDRVRRMLEQQNRLSRMTEEVSRLRKYMLACANYVVGLEEALTSSLDLENLLQEEGFTLQRPRPGRRP